MKGLYIGSNEYGTTSASRYAAFNLLLEDVDIIETSVVQRRSNKLYTSLAFRYNVGPVVYRYNKLVQKSLSTNYSVIWVDKGVWMNRKTIQRLVDTGAKLVHYTPDMAFRANASRYFNRSIRFYSLIVTTKSNELMTYKKFTNESRIMYYPQTIPSIPECHFLSINDKKFDVIFIGLAEIERIKIVVELIRLNLEVVIGGKGWNEVIDKLGHRDNVHFLGENVRGKEYFNALRNSKIGLGLLSKRFSETHTTRTFEIPSCGTVLFTESTDDIRAFYSDQDVIFYEGIDDLLYKVQYYMDNKEKLEQFARNSFRRLKELCVTNDELISKALKRLLE